MYDLQELGAESRLPQVCPPPLAKEMELVPPWRAVLGAALVTGGCQRPRAAHFGQGWSGAGTELGTVVLKWGRIIVTR